jgi:hypothetical protein
MKGNNGKINGRTIAFQGMMSYHYTEIRGEWRTGNNEKKKKRAML